MALLNFFKYWFKSDSLFFSFIPLILFTPLISPEIELVSVSSNTLLSNVLYEGNALLVL